ncbi:hypothetical protein [Undibacterium sp.]|uniref:hypothetical protein n=1 Tax=Undibacterium sp. TaxID=1914977 RepID=UPI00374D35BC
MPAPNPTMPQYLRRYTDLPALLYLLKEKKITLLDPASWDDSNDSHYLSRYKEKKGLSSVLAVCFSQADETYHHWRVFSGSASGICIRFKREPLLRALHKQQGVMLGEVNYMTLAEPGSSCPAWRHCRLSSVRRLWMSRSFARFLNRALSPCAAWMWRYRSVASTASR